MLILATLVSGCTEAGDGPAAPSELSEDEKVGAVRIALENTTVREYLSGEYEIRDVYYDTLTSTSGGVERSERLPVVTIDTKDVRLRVFVDHERGAVAAIAKNYKRTPVIVLPATQPGSTPPRGRSAHGAGPRAHRDTPVRESSSHRAGGEAAEPLIRCSPGSRALRSGLVWRPIGQGRRVDDRDRKGL